MLRLSEDVVLNLHGVFVFAFSPLLKFSLFVPLLHKKWEEKWDVSKIVSLSPQKWEEKWEF